jgi:hypothetical protein
MCTVAAGLMTAQIIGVGISAIGLFQQGRQESAEAQFRSRIASNNAIIAGQNADLALEKGRADVRDERRKTVQRIGAQRAQLAAQGFDVSEGSSIDILGDTAALGELDVLRIEADAENRARNFEIQAQGFESEATLGRFAAKGARRAGTIGAVSTLITGASRAGTTFLDRKTP